MPAHPAHFCAAAARLLDWAENIWGKKFK